MLSFLMFYQELSDSDYSMKLALTKTCLTFILFFCSVLELDAQQICLGLNEDGGFGRPSRNCPAGAAIFGVLGTAPSRNSPPELIPINASCCMLPADDILVGSHVEVLESCPEGYIATGGDPSTSCNDCKRKMRCSKINDTRYKLGPATAGAFWGFGVVYYKQDIRFMREEIPLALRPGIGRVSKFSWGEHGCIAYPFGGVLTGKTTKRCQGFSFKQIQYKGLKGDPPEGTPVTMFPRCDKISSIFNKDSKCLRWNRSAEEQSVSRERRELVSEEAVGE